jgi:single-strand DNA-binding protein
MNFVNLIGHVGQDPVVRTLEGGTKVMTFSLATTEKWQKGDQKHEVTTWHNIVAWRWLADIPVEKGNKVMVIGKITNRSYQDKDGVTRYTTEIIPTYMEICKRFSKMDESRLPGVDANPYGNSNLDADGFTNPTNTNTENINTGTSEADDLPF